MSSDGRCRSDGDEHLRFWVFKPCARGNNKKQIIAQHFVGLFLFQQRLQQKKFQFNAKHAGISGTCWHFGRAGLMPASKGSVSQFIFEFWNRVFGLFGLTKYICCFELKTICCLTENMYVGFAKQRWSKHNCYFVNGRSCFCCCGGQPF